MDKNGSTNRHFVERTSCPACGSTQFQQIYDNPMTESPIREYLLDFYGSQGGIQLEVLEGANFTLDECQKCGLVFQRYIGNDEMMGILYEQWLEPDTDFEKHQQMHPLQYYVKLNQEIMTLIAYFDKLPKDLAFFDFGMGWGSWPRMAKAFGCDAYGHDLSPSREEYARKHGVITISWDEIPDHKFDFINTEQVFEHIPEPLATLKHLKQALKPGGLIKVSVPNGRGIKEKLALGDWAAPKGSKNSLNAVAPLEHINCFTYDVIVRMGAEVGLEEVQIPILKQLIYTTNWQPNTTFVKNIARPIYRNVTKRTPIVYLRLKR